MTGRGGVAIVYLGRPGALGLQRRVDSWRAITEAAGRRAHLVDVARFGRAVEPGRVRGLLRGELVPEAFAWSRRALTVELRVLAPDVVVCVTARAYDASCLPPGSRVVLDLVDLLSDNYRVRRTRHASAGRRLAYWGLEGSMRRFEGAPHHGARRTVAGYGDARTASADWVPNVLSEVAPDRPRTEHGRTHDLLFHGSLGYEPNVEALVAFRTAWAGLRRVRPSVSLLVAGARPCRQVVELVDAVDGWTLLPDFPSLPLLMQQVRVAVAPLLSATGFQNKVLETAAHGVPQVVSGAARRGLDPAFPVLGADTPQTWVEAVAGLLDDPRRAQALGAQGRAHVEAHYRPGCYASWL